MVMLINVKEEGSAGIICAEVPRIQSRFYWILNGIDEALGHYVHLKLYWLDLMLVNLKIKIYEIISPSTVRLTK